MKDKDTLTLYKWMVINNCVTTVATAVLVLGLYWLSNSWYSLWGLLLLLTISWTEKEKEEE